MYATRLKAVCVLLGLGILLVLASLFRIQVVEGSRYREEADQRLKRPPGFHPTIRGAILDRNGLVLAQDTGAFDVAVYFPYIEMADAFVTKAAKDAGQTPEEFRGRVARMWPELARLTGTPPDELQRRVDTIRARVEVIRQSVRQTHGRNIRVREENAPPRVSVAHPLVYDVDLRTVGAVSSRPEDFPGLVVQPTRKREYPYGNVAPHLVGLLGEVGPEELAGRLNDDHPPGDLKRYWPGDWVGRGGIEGACEDLLRGSRGLFQKGIEGNFLEDIAPVPGQDVHLTLDVALQADVEELLDHPPTSAGRIVGSAVVIDCRTGEVLALATAPRYDVRTFQKDFPNLMHDKARPLVNRAVAGAYPLGSVFKAVTATAGLQEGVITPQTSFTCNGVLDPAHPNRFRCDIFVTHGASHGTISLRTAIQKSCNIYFYHVGQALGRGGPGGWDIGLARDRLQAWAARLGFGRPTGIGLGGEAAGRIDVPDPRNLAVGQGELLVTPIQVAQVYGLVATSGQMPLLRLIRERANPAGSARPDLSLNPQHMSVLRDGFSAVVNEQGGTGYNTVYIPDIHIAGKTGTAQSGGGEPHAWFAGFVPAENPRVAFAVIVEHGGHGGTAAGPIAREIVKACQAHGYLADKPAATPPAPPPPQSVGKANGDRSTIKTRHDTPKPPVTEPKPPVPVG